MIDIPVGERFSTTVALDAAGISAFAHAAGDENPIHHDAAYADATRFGGVLASGAQSSSLLMGLVASRFSEGVEMVGLEFGFRFRAPVRVPQRVTVEWLVVGGRPAPRLGGTIVELRGRLLTEAGHTAVGATAKILVTDRL